MSETAPCVTLRALVGMVDAALSARPAQQVHIEALTDAAADWLDGQGARVLVRQTAPGIYVVSPRAPR